MSDKTITERFWHADRLAPTIVVAQISEPVGAVLFGDNDAPCVVTPAEAIEIGECMIAAANALTAPMPECCTCVYPPDYDADTCKVHGNPAASTGEQHDAS
jgi:hypothetical protein